MTSQQGVLLPAGKVDDPSSTSLPAFNPDTQDASTLYASLFETSTTRGKAAVEVQDVPLSAYLPPQDCLLLVHASTSSSSLPVNRLANEILLNQQHGDGTAAASTSTSIKGQAYVLYAGANRDFTLDVDWEALHDVCYGAHLAKAGKQATTTTNLQELAKQFIAKREQLAKRSQSNSRGTKVDTEDDEAWTDEEIEQPREPKKDAESDDENEAEGQNGDEDEEDDEDSEASYEDESELESDEDDDDPRKQALLEMIQQAIMKDGKLDLER